MAQIGTTPSGKKFVTLDELEKRYIKVVLKHSRTLNEAADTLGINLSTLWRKRKRTPVG
jgi:transcriptional regulator with PAS, ATPase and Fis domain